MSKMLWNVAELVLDDISEAIRTIDLNKTICEAIKWI